MPNTEVFEVSLSFKKEETLLLADVHILSKIQCPQCNKELRMQLD